jgi:hypothetical protein
MLTNLSTYVKFAKIAVFHISVSGKRNQNMWNHKYVAHAYCSANFTYAEIFVSITY